LFLPISKEGVSEFDYILINGDAYVDHPSFGAAIIGRFIQSLGYSVGVIAQPDWKNLESFKILGKPKYAFLVTGGNIDSMVSHYTTAKKRRGSDAYSPGGQAGFRPDRATIVYTNKIKEAYKDVFIIIGGIEASLRRLSHYDYWDNKVRRSILLDSGADILVYGMGEHQLQEITNCLKQNNFEALKNIRGICYKNKALPEGINALVLPSYTEVCGNKDLYAKSFMAQYNNSDAFTAKILIEPYAESYVVQNPPAMPVSTALFDKVYALPYMRAYHPIYESAGGVPAIEEVKFSLISSRGCFGSCNFCALSFHQGRIIQARCHASIISEAEGFKWDADFKGYIHDVGGPTANFRTVACKKQSTKGACAHKKCLFPEPCKNLQVSHSDYIKLLRKLRDIPGVKKVFIRSGIRYDYLIYDKNKEFFTELCKHHISGQLKVAPEHVSENVLDKMGKPRRNVYEKFTGKYYQLNKTLGMEQYLVPYLMSSHPGSDLASAVELAEYLRDINFTPEQVQDFYPTPGTLSTCMYYTGKDPRTGKEVYVPKSSHEKAMQRALIQYKNPKNYELVREALYKAGRSDLIGFGKNCLIRPRREKAAAGALRSKSEPTKSVGRNIRKRR